MSQEPPWSIKGIKSGNRETAKEQAFRRGITIGEWINGLIETAGTGEISNNNHGQNYAMAAVPNDMRPYPGPKRFAEPNVFGENETSRLARAMEALNRKLDNAVGFTAPANSDLGFGDAQTFRDSIERAEKATERAISSIIERLENSDRNNNQNFNRISSTLQDVKQAQDTIHERVRRLEQDDPSNKSINALRALENQLQKLAHQIIANEERTDKIAKDIRDISIEKSSRLDPEEVEKILNGQINNYKTEVSRKIDEIGERISSVEEIATVSIEQTDKGITLLSDRVRDAELSTAKATENVKEALIDLSARISQIESNAPNSVKQAIDSRFSSISHKFDEIDAKFHALQEDLLARLNASENDTLTAIEKIGDQMVRTGKSFEDRIKTFEELNESAKDHSLSTRIELGRISHAIDSRLSALENRDSDVAKKSGDQITRLAEQITNRLEDVEAKTANFMAQLTKENRALIDSLNQTKSNLSSEIHSKFDEFNHKMDQKLDERFITFSKAGDSKINHSLDDIINRLESIEAKGVGFTGETMYPPKGFGSNDSFADLQPFTTNEIEFDNSKSEIGSEEEAFKSVFGENEHQTSPIFDDSADSVFDITGAESRDDNLLNQWSNTSQPEKATSYLDNARRAAIEAANSSLNAKKNAKPKKAKPEAAPKVEALEPVFDEQIGNVPKKRANKPMLSPLGMVAAGALVIATATTGAMYVSGNKKQPNQNELPNALKDSAPPAAPAPVANPNEQIPPEAMGAAPVIPGEAAHIPAPSNGNQAAATAATPAVNPVQNGEKRHLEGSSQAIATPPAQKVAPPAAPAPKPQANAEGFKKLIPVNPFKAPQIAKPVTPPPEPVRVASATPPPIAKPAPPVSAGASLYDQALAKQKLGDNNSAIALFTKAADTGEVKAINRLAKMYEKGDGVTKNMNEARKWTEKAAQLGSKQAQHNLGVYYAEGEGATQDFKKAAENFAKAAKKGVTDSQFNLGAMSEQGLGVEKSKSDAYYWYALAAKSGDADALKKTKEISTSLNPQEKSILDKKIETFKPEAGTPD